MTNYGSNKVRKLDSSLFKFGNKEGTIIPFKIFTSFYKDLAEWILKQPEFMGICKTPEWQGSKGFESAVMMNFDGNEYWCHIPNQVYKILENGELKY